MEITVPQIIIQLLVAIAFHTCGMLVAIPVTYVVLQRLFKAAGAKANKPFLTRAGGPEA